MLPSPKSKNEKNGSAVTEPKIDLMKLPYGIQKSIIYGLSAPALSRLSQTNTYFADLISKCSFRGRVSSIAFWHYKYPSHGSATYSDKYSLLVTYMEFSESKTVFFKNELPEKLYNLVTDRLRLAGGVSRVEKELLQRLKQYNLKTNGLCTELLVQSIPEAVAIVDCSYLRLIEGEEPHITLSLFESIQEYNLLGFWTDIPIRQDAFLAMMMRWKSGHLKMPVVSYVIAIVNDGLNDLLANMHGKPCQSCLDEFDRCFEFQNTNGQRAVLMLQSDNWKNKNVTQIITALFGVGANNNIEKHYKNCIYYTKLT